MRPDEHEALARLIEEAYTGWVPESYLAVLGDVASRARAAVVLVAVGTATGQVAGGVTYVPGPGPYAEFEDEREAGIRMLAVAAELRRTGVGTLLTEACLSRARDEDRVRVSLHTPEDNRPARQLYEAIGFRAVPERDLVVGDDTRLVGYVFDLPGSVDAGPGGETGETRGA